MFSKSSSSGEEEPGGSAVRGGVGGSEGNFNDGGRILCERCLGNEDGGGDAGVDGDEVCLSGADDEAAGAGEVGVVGIEGVKGAAKDSLSSAGNEVSNGAVGMDGADDSGDDGGTIRGRRGTFVGCCP